jgi:hypothetical protein
MKHLSGKLKALLIMAVKQSGSYDPDECLVYIEESLTIEEVDVVEKFLTWMHKMGLAFGTANIDHRYQEFLKQRKAPAV